MLQNSLPHKEHLEKRILLNGELKRHKIGRTYDVSMDLIFRGTDAQQSAGPPKTQDSRLYGPRQF